MTFVRVQNEGDGVGAPSPSRPIGKRIRTRRILSTKSESDQGSPPREKRDSAPVGDLDAANNNKTRATAEAGSKKGRLYKLLTKEFRRDGFQYRQIARKGGAAIYEQRWTGCAEPSPAYEVIRIRRRGGFRIGDRFVEPAEVYPASKLWGVDGFTLTDSNKAWAKFFEISLKKQQGEEGR